MRHLRDLERVVKGAICTLAKAGVVAQQVTEIAEGTEVATMARDGGCGPVTRQVRIADTRGRVPAVEVTVYGWTVRLLSDALTRMPLGGHSRADPGA